MQLAHRSTQSSRSSCAALKIVAASLEAMSKIPSSIEWTARLAAKCQIKDLYISVIINFSGKESQMKRKCT